MVHEWLKFRRTESKFNRHLLGAGKHRQGGGKGDADLFSRRQRVCFLHRNKVLRIVEVEEADKSHILARTGLIDASIKSEQYPVQKGGRVGRRIWQSFQALPVRQPE